MLNPKRFAYNLGIPGVLYQLYDTRTYKPDLVGLAAWQLTNAGAMWTATRWLTGEGQTWYSTYRPVVQEALYKGDASLFRSIRGPKGPSAVLLVGTYVANITVDNFLPPVSIENEFA